MSSAESDHLMQTAVLGLGAMGSGMALNLHRHGALCAAWNRTYSNAEHLLGQPGFPLQADLMQAVSGADLIITCVSADEDLLELVERFKPALKPGQILLDTSTVSVETVQCVAQNVQPQGVTFIDAPVSGGSEGAANGQLVMMAGGDAGLIDRLRPTLACISRTVTHMGPTGMGQATKAVNQVMAAGINQGVTEALAFGLSMGLDMDRVIPVIAGGAAGNWFLDHRGETMLHDKFDPGFKLKLHLKDLRICKQMLADQGKRSELLETTLADYETLLREGHGDEDISTLFHIKRRHYIDG